MAPWTKLALEAPVVITIRLMQMPWLALTNESAGRKENIRMVSEKIEAMQEFQQAAMMAPMRFYMDFAKTAMTGRYSTIFHNTLKSSSTRLAKPYTSRVSSNRRRLSKGR